MNLSIDVIILLGFFLRVCVAFWNGFFGPSPGADLDAAGLNGFASDVAITGSFDELSIGYTPYTNVLGIVYSYTFNHLFVGSVLSCLIWWMSAHCLYKSCLILGLDEQRVKTVLFIYALLPSSIFITGVTLREPYQLFFVNLAIYAILRIYSQRAGRHWITLILAIAGAGSLHGGLLAFGTILFAGTLLLVSMREQKAIKLGRAGWVGLVATCVVWYVFSAFGNISYNLDEGLGSAIEVYQQGALLTDGRTNYRLDAAISGLGDLLLFIPVAIFQYLFEPFPWNVSAASDVVVVLENILRGWLIWNAWKALRVAPPQQRRVFVFLFISYLAMETVWSVGTVNWGTAVRHHLPALGILLLVAYAASDRKAQ